MDEQELVWFGRIGCDVRGLQFSMLHVFTIFFLGNEPNEQDIPSICTNMHRCQWSRKRHFYPVTERKLHLAFQVKTNLNETLLCQSRHSSLFLGRKIWLHCDLAAWTKHQEVSLTIERPRFNVRSERIATLRYQARSQPRYGPNVGSFSKSHVMGSKVSLLWLFNLQKPSFSRNRFRKILNGQISATCLQTPLR